MDDFEERLQEVLGDDDEQCARNSQRWRQHLLTNLTLPLRVTGTEDFPWEEPYVFGAWDADEYEDLKKTKPSYTDTFELLEIGEPDEDNDLTAKVKRVSDQKMFDIGLSWLIPTSKKDPAYTMMDDYAVWHYNY